MMQQLIDDMTAYFEAIPQRTTQEQRLLNELTSGYFPITSVHRDDLEACGFDTSQVTDDDMVTLAGKMEKDYTEQCFWISLPIIAAGYLGIPERESNQSDSIIDTE